MKKNQEAFMKMIAAKKNKPKNRVDPSAKLTDKFLKGQDKKK